jgi:hypothetical protein
MSINYCFDSMNLTVSEARPVHQLELLSYFQVAGSWVAGSVVRTEALLAGVGAVASSHSSDRQDGAEEVKS